MSVRRLATQQPDSFAFSDENLKWAQDQINMYPDRRGRSAVIALLWRAQKQNDNWLTEPAIRVVAEMLNMPFIRVLEIATFYTMFNLQPVGKYFIQLCGTTPCMLSGSTEIRNVCTNRIGPSGAISDDGLFSWMEVECLGACGNGPMAQINDTYVEDLTAANFNKLLDDLKEGKPLQGGSLSGRSCSEPKQASADDAINPTITLKTAGLYNGSRIGLWRDSPHWQKAISDGIAPKSENLADINNQDGKKNSSKTAKKQSSLTEK